MTHLNLEEIQNIASLLLSPDDKNVRLALSLLQAHKYALPKIKDAVVVFSLFSPKEKKVARWIAKAFPELDLREHPAYPLSAALFDDDYEDSLPTETHLEHLMSAQEPFEKYIVAKPIWAAAYEQLADLIKTRYPSNYSLVLPYYRKARKHSPNSATAAFSLAHSLHYTPSPFEKTEDYASEVLDGYTSAYEILPLAKALYATATFSHYRNKDKATASHYYQLCIKNHPDYPFSYNGWAELLLEQNQAERAKKLALKGLKKLPSKKGREHFFDTLGHIEWKGFQNYKQAATYFARATKIKPLHWESTIGAAEMFFEIKDYANATKWYNMALKCQPKNLEVLKQLTLIQEHLENIDSTKD